MLALQSTHYLGQLNHSKEAGGFSAGITTYPNVPYAENLHYHEAFILSLVINGGNLEKRNGGEVERTPGTVTCHDAGEPHQSTRMLSGSCHVNVEIADGFMKAHELHTHAAALEKGSSADARFLMLNIYKELVTNDSESLLSIEASLLHLLQFTGKSDRRQDSPAWVLKVREALYDKWNENLTLNELAIIANLHPVNLSGYFPQYFGCTMGEFRRKIKMEKALELLKYRDLSLTAIAHDCGFADQSHFTRTCRELTGWNPKQLKAMQH
ncbi:AraC family transcriptional regulator [Mucilaginibacter sp. BJC16-A38]|uniref:helix-turn-helix transcriptional regulator n=1 Tax=Mucilaginibacter phenanthrenivorans TaxID=1234842 RepID=UPI002157E732|nr:AraC family transcriptional regulator [Mucilaginibacter phenanthrenivorans]MCR8559397.1 AraC family transcriptional regulator [Mucilaginibacter phenanthrenivorans]